jgi:hypothetical protein
MPKNIQVKKTQSRKSPVWKHTETSMHQSSRKGNGNDAPMAALTTISGWDTF